MIYINNIMYHIQNFEYELVFLPKITSSLTVTFDTDVEELYAFLNKNKNTNITLQYKDIVINKILKWVFYLKEKQQIVFLLEEDM